MDAGIQASTQSMLYVGDNPLTGEVNEQCHVRLGTSWQSPRLNASLHHIVTVQNNATAKRRVVYVDCGQESLGPFSGRSINPVRTLSAGAVSDSDRLCITAVDHDG